VNPRVLLCCGTGGVGKTTTAAALGVACALAGQRAVVLTIDPARRLADALGLAALDNDPRAVDLATLGAAGDGTLHALMLDRKTTFDDAVRRLSNDADAADRLLANRYYRAVSTRLTGAHEYMATEKLHELATSGRFDTVIVDTPPSRHAIDFFHAPVRVQQLFDSPVVRRLVNPGRGLTGGGTRRLLAWVLSLVGSDVIEDIGEFFRLMSSVSEGFSRHGGQVAALMRSDRTTLLLVTTAASASREGALAFVREAGAEGLQLGGFVLNRVVPAPPAIDHAFASPPAGLDEDWRAWRRTIEAEASRQRAIATRHAAAARDLSLAAGGAPVHELPLVAEGLGSTQALAALARRLLPAVGDAAPVSGSTAR
jgi:anion-transporting  ArsA/GET3 family ATPase